MVKKKFYMQRITRNDAIGAVLVVTVCLVSPSFNLILIPLLMRLFVPPVILVAGAIWGDTGALSAMVILAALFVILMVQSFIDGLGAGILTIF